MPTMPVPTNTDLAVQNTTTGQLDYLQFQGSTLVASDAVDFGIAGWNVVAQGSFGGNHQDLVIQNAAGAVDFLTLDAHGNLTGSAMSNVDVAPIVGQGNFSQTAPFQQGPTLVSQMANGQLDMLGFNAAGALTASDAVAGSVGLPHAVGVGEGTPGFETYPLFSKDGTGPDLQSDNVVLQLADGSLDSIGFIGLFSNGSLTVGASFLVPGSAGSAPVEAINQQNDLGGANESLLGGTGTGGTTLEGAQFIEQLGNGTFDSVFADSGYGDSSHEGTIYSSDVLNLSLPGWHAVDAGGVAQELFPIT